MDNGASKLGNFPRTLFIMLLMRKAHICGRLVAYQYYTYLDILQTSPVVKFSGNFSCNRDLEWVYREGSVGSLQSPCYDGISAYYPEELTGGRKLINITHDNPFLVGRLNTGTKSLNDV